MAERERDIAHAENDQHHLDRKDNACYGGEIGKEKNHSLANGLVTSAENNQSAKVGEEPEHSNNENRP